MPISTATFATNLAALLGLNSGDTTSLINLVESWDPTTPTDLAQQVVSFVNNAGLRDTSYNDWWTGTTSGGPGGDGYYPINLFGGGTTTLPCPAKMLSSITHGADAQTGICLDVLGPFNNGERLRMMSVSGNITINPSNVTGYALTSPTLDTTFVIKKNLSAWGTITFLAGHHNTVIASFSDTSLAHGDVLELFAPSIVDATLANFAFTIPGV